MAYTPRTYTPEPYAQILYEGFSKLAVWLDEDPEQVLLANDLDFENVQIAEKVYLLSSQFADPPEELRHKTDEALYVSSMLFWGSAAFAMVYEFQKALIRELSAVPTAKGEVEIADIRKDLAEIQEVLLGSPIFGAAVSAAALAGDAKFVTRIDFLNPKWHKTAEAAADTEK